MPTISVMSEALNQEDILSTILVEQAGYCIIRDPTVSSRIEFYKRCWIFTGFRQVTFEVNQCTEGQYLFTAL